MWKCACDAENTDNYKFCPECGDVREEAESDWDCIQDSGIN